MPDGTPCQIPDCERSAAKLGWCKPHHLRWWRYGDPLAGRGTVKPLAVARQCQIDGCERSHAAQGYCGAHYQRWVATGHAGAAEVQPRRKGAVCDLADCSRRHYARGMCTKHYQRWLHHGDPETVLPGPWKGDSVGYSAVHERLVTARGSARLHRCSHCGRGAMDWAYDNSCPNEQIGVRHGRLLAYSTDPDRYMPLCRSCHQRLDGVHSPSVPISE